MKFGIIGAGMIGSFHAQAIAAMQGGTLGGVADRASERTTAFAVQYSTKAYDSVDAMLADPEIEVVTIGTPSGAHFDPAMAAIEAGKHVIIEKPLEVTTERIDQMIAAARAKGVTLAAVLNRRFHPGMDAFKKAADAGRFGKLTNASAYVKWYRDQAYYDSAGWRGTWALDGGGALMNQSIHTIDALLYLAGPVKSVQANTACLAHVDIEVEDIAVAILEFESGARGIIEGSTCTWSKDGHPARVQLAGTEGSVFLADEAFEIWDFMHETEADESIRAQFMQGADAGLGANDPTAISFYQHQRNFEEVVNAIQAGREPSTGAAEARKSVELIQAIYQSAQNDGAKITLR
ncbi:MULTISPECIES: Gfo/Idh/MocA family protein [unclassified Lentimonas]|uniref:Gfo/Idh/MocA family protein n=1 Tax=unclassified Lentimonas TaxID=2630993 RepID=UPI001324B656|nr:MULTISPECIES: Gfo/Idh/MocA family oxidoreductase [unclassified Lentimonas]CAA6693585.1 Myo-inositol 2-dehydrogenase (EC [Lentimonas sp. CC19]CAA6695931.1 Myo-inositol 2-dehydrogenase (EC [Lentimonas sp. CC10]CAA7069822.1 Myo-inositol 2-dehydrogenase (EC [Lentimonas sp. CC11]